MAELSRFGGPLHDISGWRDCADALPIMSAPGEKTTGKPLWHRVFTLRCAIPRPAGHLVLCKPERLCYTLPARERLFRLFLGSSAVEHSTVNRMVAGSNPARGAKRFPIFRLVRRPNSRRFNPRKSRRFQIGFDRSDRSLVRRSAWEVTHRFESPGIPAPGGPPVGQGFLDGNARRGQTSHVDIRVKAHATLNSLNPISGFGSSDTPARGPPWRMRTASTSRRCKPPGR